MIGKQPAPLDALHEALKTAVHSPSSHNSQAWLLRMTYDQGGPVLGLEIDHHRKLCALPAHRIEMLLGLGAYWHALRVALSAHGWDLDCAPARTNSSEEAILSGRMAPWSREPATGDDIELITGRRTNRGPYADTPVGSAARDSIIHDARTRPTWAVAPGSPPDVRIISDASALTELAGLTEEVAPRDFLHRRAWRETVNHLHRDSVASSARSGFSYGQIFGQWPRPIDHLVVSLTSSALMPITGRLGLARSLSRRLAQAIEAGPGLLVMSTSSTVTSSTDWAWAGTDLHRAWLAATRHGLSLHPVSVLLQHPDSRERVERLLGLSGRAFFLARIGHGLSTTITGPVVRRSPESVLLRNR